MSFDSAIEKDTEEDEPKGRWNMNATKESVEGIVKVYGPFAFGIVSLLVIWLAIIQPELDSKRLDFNNHMEIIDKLSAENKQNEATARTLRDTALILERVVSRLEDVAGRQ